MAVEEDEILEDEILEDEELEEELEEEGDGEEEEEDGDLEEEEEEFDPEKVKNLFDPNEYPKELQPAFKKMQGIFTRKLQENKDKLTLVELMESNPEELVAMLAKKTGLTVTKEAEEEGKELSETEKWIVGLIKEHTKGAGSDIRTEVAQMKSAQRLELLSEKHPDWTMYEDEMAAIVKKHPTMADDLDTVYTLAKKSIDEAGTVLARSKKKKQVATKTRTSKKVKSEPRPKTAKEALEAAFSKLYGKD